MTTMNQIIYLYISNKYPTNTVLWKSYKRLLCIKSYDLILKALPRGLNSNKIKSPFKKINQRRRKTTRQTWFYFLSTAILVLIDTQISPLNRNHKLKRPKVGQNRLNNKSPIQFFSKFSLFVHFLEMSTTNKPLNTSMYSRTLIPLN